MNMPPWFSNLIFWSAQVALLVLAAGILQRLLRLRQPRVLLVIGARSSPSACCFHCLSPGIGSRASPQSSSPATSPGSFFLRQLHPCIALVFSQRPSHGQILGIIILAGIGVRFAIVALGLLKLGQFRRTSSPISESSELAALLEAMRARVNARAEFRLSASVDSSVTSASWPRWFSCPSVSRLWTLASSPQLLATNYSTSAATIGRIILPKNSFVLRFGSTPPSGDSSRASGEPGPPRYLTWPWVVVQE
jgi:hypothetical protein